MQAPVGTVKALLRFDPNQSLVNQAYYFNSFKAQLKFKINLMSSVLWTP